MNRAQAAFRFEGTERCYFGNIKLLYRTGCLIYNHIMGSNKSQQLCSKEGEGEDMNGGMEEKRGKKLINRDK